MPFEVIPSAPGSGSGRPSCSDNLELTAIDLTVQQKLSTSIILLLLLCAFGLAAPLHKADAANAKDKLSKIRKEIESKKEKIKESIQKEKSVLERLDDINDSIRKKSSELNKYDRRIADIRQKMSSLMKEINGMYDQLGERQDHLKERLRALYKQQYGGHALVLISATDYQDLIRKSRYISLLAHYDSKVISKYGNDIQDLLAKKKELEALNDDLITSKANAEQTKKSLETDRKKKDRLLSMIRSKRETYERSVKELEESSKKVQQMIMKMKKKKLPSSITGKGFKASRGRLPWPVPGRVAIPYGEYKDPEYGITVFKNGLEIAPEQGEKPKAVAGGRVVYADWFKGYGLLLIVDHDNGYHSLYGNLSEIFLKSGDILIEGTVVGNIGNSQILNYPTLYFEIRHKGKPVNPSQWLTRKGYPKKKVRIK